MPEPLYDPLSSLEALDRPPSASRRILRLAGMLAVATGLLWWCFRGVDAEKVAEAWAGSDLLLLLVSLGAGLTAVLVLSFAALYVSLHPVGFRGRWRSFFVALGALELASAVQAHLGGLGFLAYLKRSHGVPVRHGLGAILMQYTSDGAVLCLVALPGYWVFDPPHGRWVSAGALALLVVLLVGYGYVRGVLDFLFRGRLRVLLAPRSWAVAQPLVRASLGTYSKVVGLRLLAWVAMALGHWGALAAFGVDVPLPRLLVLSPLLVFVGDLPVTLGGFGTTQAAFLAALGGYGPAAAILAYSLSYSVIMLAVRMAFGLLTFRPGLRELRRRAASPVPGGAGGPVTGPASR